MIVRDWKSEEQHVRWKTGGARVDMKPSCSLGEQTVVEAITHVQSVDLVADPAATQGLFEQAANEPTASESPADATVAIDEAAAEHARLSAELQASAEREAELQRRLSVYESQHAWPRSSEPMARLMERRERIDSSADFARAIKTAR